DMGSRRRRTSPTKPSQGASAVRRNPPPATAAPPPRVVDQLLIAALLTILTLLVYAPARHYDFIELDDPLYLREKPHVAALTPGNVAWAWSNRHGGFWIPLVWVSYMIDAAMFGPGPGGHHATNVALHLLNTLLLLWALVRMTGAPWRSGFASALFAI